MPIGEVHYAASLGRHNLTLPTPWPCIVLMGRSNVGKSSLINLLLQRRQMAHTSSTPGKTRLINLFAIDKTWYLADLPGYGWARAARREALLWDGTNKTFIQQLGPQAHILLLTDLRHPLLPADRAMAQWLSAHNCSYALIFTKGDQCKAGERARHTRAWMDALPEGVPSFLTSVLWKAGREALLEHIEKQVATLRKYSSAPLQPSYPTAEPAARG